MAINRCYTIELFLGLCLIVNQIGYGQIGQGSASARRSGKHDGNRVYCNFTNGGYTTWNAWKHYENGYVIDIQPLVGVQLPIKDYRVNGVYDGVPDTITSTITCATHSNMDMNPSGTKFWGFEPIPGFYNDEVQGRDIGVAMSHQPQTWPAYWPDHPDWLDNSGEVEWNGYFGRGIMNADQESYFMMDDNADEKMYSFHAFLPDSNDVTRKGQGIRVSVRGLQWQNPLAQDIIFWIYEVTNVGTADYERVSFGALVGTYVGGAGTEWNDDASFFNIQESIVYSWDFDDYVSPAANPSWVGDPDDVGYIGYAFLESPGHSWDGIDNDGDNKDALGSNAPYFDESSFEPRIIQTGDQLILIDRKSHSRTPYTVPDSITIVESMDILFTLVPGETTLEEGNMILGNAGPELNPNAYDGIDNDLDGLIDENYQLHFHQYKKSVDGVVLLDTENPVQYIDYFTGQGINDLMLDEGRNDGIDNDGDWDITQDDVGADGKADTGDEGENDGEPTNGEPHFDSKDVDESDQIGLTSFDYFVPSTDVHPNDEDDMWERLKPGRFDVPESVVENRPIRGEDGDFIFGSGYFPLYAGETQSFSIALVYGEKYESVVRTKNIAQLIYNSNYNFPRAPDRPTVHAIGMDGKVMLYWDRVAESSYDKVLGEYDFEGYRIYKSTDPNFSDSEVITNGYGEVVAEYPYYQMDLNNDIKGWFYPDELLYDLVNGQPYYLGDDSGIQNTFIDKDVDNGRTYYYAVCAYDHGSVDQSIYPSENSKSITQDITGIMTFERNTVTVTPNAPVSNYVAPESGQVMRRIDGVSTAVPILEVVNAELVKDAGYVVTFEDMIYHNEVRIAKAYTVLDSISGDTVMATNDYWGPSNGDIFDGIRLSFNTEFQNLNNVSLDTINTYWNNTSLTDVEVLATGFEYLDVKSIRCPYDYMLVFHDDYNYRSSRLSTILGSSAPLREIQTNIEIFEVTDLNNPKPLEFGLLDFTSYPGTISHFTTIFLTTSDSTQLSWRLVFKDRNLDDTFIPPSEGDTLFIAFQKPFTSDDMFVFTTQKSATDNDDMRKKLNQIRVVPNPYIVTSEFEKPLTFGLRGRGERVLNFIHLPAGAHIRIFSPDGSFIRHLKHDEGLEDGSVVWDLKTHEGLDISYGVYFYVVEIDGYQKSGKIAIIK
ncbi:MAG: hypothetical protein GWP19_00700 [Planctomycetia bacterium]|nr:hypothetical protein [Planctomycetia bacterium]